MQTIFNIKSVAQALSNMLYAYLGMVIVTRDIIDKSMIKNKNILL
jgi:hypothetical protein